MKRIFHIFLLLSVVCSFLPARASVYAGNYSQLTDLPALYIETFSGKDITSKDVYQYARLYYVEGNSVTKYDSMQIRGRGNSTWTAMAKKSYRIKFHEKEKFLGTGYAKARNWTLMANAADKSMIRNALTSYLGQYLGLKFNPAARFVDLYLNSKYLGTYQISDQVEIHPHRVNITEQTEAVTSDTFNVTGGYLLEVDGFTDANETYFYTGKGIHIRLHSPDHDLINYRQTNYIKDYVQKFENALFSDQYTDRDNGYRPYVDTLSLVNWYIATEVSANMDGFWSTYFYKDRDNPLLYFGPLWDYDIAYNNCNRIGDVTEQLMADVGFGVALTRIWVDRMWNDPWFAQAVYRRFSGLMQQGLDSFMVHCVDSLSGHINRSQEENYEVWSINTRVYNEITLYNTYDAYVAELRTFIPKHNAYLLSVFASRKPITPTPAFHNATGYYYRIYNKGYSAAVIDVTGSDTLTGSTVCMYENQTDRSSQQWLIHQTGTSYMLLNRKSLLALADPSTVSTSYVQLQTVTPDSTDQSQLWQIVPQGTDGYYNLKNVGTGHTANNSGGFTANNNPIIGYESSSRDATSNNRLWLLEPDEPVVTAITAPQQSDVDYALKYNPSTQSLHFTSTSPEQMTFSANIYDMNGRKISSFSARESFDVRMLPHALYIVTWTCGGRQHSIKFLKR